MKKYKKNFLLINFTGDHNFIGIKYNNRYLYRKIQNKNTNYDDLVGIVIQFLKHKKIEINNSFITIVNLGPGSFSGIRASISVAKGILLAKKVPIFSLNQFTLLLGKELKNKLNYLIIIKVREKYFFLQTNPKSKCLLVNFKNIDKKLKMNSKIKIISPIELKNDKNLKKFKEKIIFKKYSLENIDFLLKYNLLRKNLKPIYLS